MDVKIDGWAGEAEDGNVTFALNGSGAGALCDSLAATPYQWLAGNRVAPDGVSCLPGARPSPRA